MKNIIAIFIIFLTATNLYAQSWQEIFADSILQGYIAEALENNSDIKTAQLSLQQSETMLKSARLSYLPTFAFAPSLEINKERNASASYTYKLPVTMNWEINFGGKQRFEKEIAKLQVQRDTQQLKAAQIQIIADLANAYYTLISLNRQYEITQQGLENQQETLRVLRALKEVGQQSEIAVNQAEASYQSTAASLPVLESQIKKAETSVCLILNREPAQIERTSWQKINDIQIDFRQEIPLENLSSRPDVLSAEYALRAALGNVKIARSDFYPTLSISASAGLTDLALNALGSLIQPLFQQGKLKANRKSAQLQYQQAEITFKKTLLVASAEVHDALADCQAFAMRKEARLLQVSAAQKAFENSRETMRYAQMSYLEVLTAQNSYLEAQLQQSADFLEFQQCLINLYKAVCY